jgi:hypothetical protein
MQKVFIKNRQGLKISVLIEQPEGHPEGIGFILHGHSSIKEAPRNRVIRGNFC